MKSPPITEEEEEATPEEPSKSNKHQAKHRRRKERRLLNADERLQKNLQLLSQGKCPVWLDTEVEEYESSNLAESGEEEETTLEQEVPQIDILNEWYNEVNSMIVDSGTTSTIGSIFDDRNDKFIPTGEKSTKVFKVANGIEEKATEKKLLQHKLRPASREVNIVPGITNSLLSTSKLADDNYITIFDKDKVEIFDATNTKVITTRGAIIRGFRCPITGLHRVPLVPTNEITNLNTDTILCSRPPTEYLRNRPPPTEAINNVYELRTQAELVRYFHAAAGFPTQATWIRAIKRGFFASWPGLTEKAVRKHFPESEETQKGHMKAQKSGIRSTKKTITTHATTTESSNIDDLTPTSKQRDIMVVTYDLEDELVQKIATDQTGNMPKKSMRGYRYIMALAEMDSDAILVEPMRNRTAGEMVKTYQKLIDRLKKCGIKPKMHILDNECSEEFKQAIEGNNMKYQLVPPHNHRRNIAERAIQTFKAHFISTLCGVDPNFPLALWCYLLPQAEMTLNMLRPSRTTPNVSAYAHLHGQHDYNAHPLAPLGMQCEMHVMPDVRETFAPHSVSGYNVGTSFEHYRCYTIYIKSTRRTRVGNTIFFKHKYLTLPTITNADALLKSAEDMTTALKGGIPQTSETTAAIQALLAIYKENANAEKEKENAANSQRVRMNEARTQRVLEEIKQATSTAVPPMETEVVPLEVEQVPPLEAERVAPLEVEYPSTSTTIENDYVAANTRARRAAPRTITQEAILTTIDISKSAENITARQTASRKYPLAFLCDLAAAVLDGETGEMLEFRHLMKSEKYREVWGDGYGNEVGRLAQGREKTGLAGTDTLFFIRYEQIPADRRRDVTYERICCNVRPEKEDPNRVRATLGGNQMAKMIDCGTPTADLLTVKLLFNSIVSTPNAKFMSIDISNFYLNTPLDRYEYVRMKLANFPPDMIEQYKLNEIVDSKGCIYCEVRKGMYGMPSAGILAQNLLEKRLGKAGYHQSKFTPGYWTHEWRPISFTLVVDDFGVKYVGKEHAEHLLTTINNDYTCKADWDGRRYLGLTLDWDYERREVHLSMPGYVHEALQRFNHTMPKKPQHQPHKHVVPTYGQTIQYAQVDDSPSIDKASKTFIQQVSGTFLYYARAVDPTMLVTLSALASAQANPTEETMEKCKTFLNYAATHPDAIVTYRASNMILSIHSDASYLTEPQARSRVGGHYVMSKDVPIPPNNGAVLNIAQIIKTVVSSAAEAEVHAAFINAKEAVPMRTTLWEMGHPQPPTPMQIDNTTALGYIKNNIKAKGSKSWDMKLHWLRDRATLQQFKFFWRPGPTNDGDYYTKHFSSSDHQAKRPEILTDQEVLIRLRKLQGLEPPVFTTSERVC